MYNVALLLCFELSFICAKKSEGGPIARVSEVKASFRNFSPMRPIIMRLADTMLKVEKFRVVLSLFDYAFLFHNFLHLGLLFL